MKSVPICLPRSSCLDLDQREESRRDVDILSNRQVWKVDFWCLVGFQHLLSIQYANLLITKLGFQGYQRHPSSPSSGYFKAWGSIWLKSNVKLTEDCLTSPIFINFLAIFHKPHSPHSRMQTYEWQTSKKPMHLSLFKLTIPCPDKLPCLFSDKWVQQQVLAGEASWLTSLAKLRNCWSTVLQASLNASMHAWSS